MKQNELQRVRRQLVQHMRDGPQLVLAHLDDAQALAEQGVADGLHRRGFAGARVAGEQDVRRRLALQQRPGCLRRMMARWAS